MFAKIFNQIYDSSIVESPETRFTFMDLLILADKNGVVDMTHEAIARRTNRPLELVKKTISELEGPDPRSRTPDAGGARIFRLDDHRDWGWGIINYDYFRKLASEEQRREKTRLRVAKLREKKRKQAQESLPVTLCNAPLRSGNDSPSASASASEKKGSVRGFPHGLPDSEWIEQLCHDPTYAGIDVKREHGKMVNWCKTKGLTPSRRRFINWLNRAEQPMTAPVRTDYPKDWSQTKIKEYEEAKKKYG